MALVALASLGFRMNSLCACGYIDRASPARVVRVRGIVMAGDAVAGIDRAVMAVRGC